MTPPDRAYSGRGGSWSRGPRVNSYLRLFPYVWPHRRKFFWSVLFAVLVAGLWGLTLSMGYPVLTVLFENKSLEQYIDESIDRTQKIIKVQEQTLDEHEDEQKHLDAAKVGLTENEQLRALRRLSRDRSNLSSASYKLMVLNWIKGKVVPRLPHDKFRFLTLIFVALMVLTLAKGACEFVQETLICQLVELSLMGLRKALFSPRPAARLSDHHPEGNAEAAGPLHQ